MTDHAPSPWASEPPSGGGANPPPAAGPPPAYVAGPAARRPRRALAAAVAVLAVGAGGFGVLALSSGDGADTPGAAVEAMFEAIDQEDVIGVLEALDPTERAILRPAVEQTGQQAERVEVASTDLDLRKVQGVDLAVEGLTYTTEDLGDGVTAVDLTGGTVSSSADLDRMAVGATVQAILDRDAAEAGGDVDRRASDTIELDGVRLVARRSGGGWHVSALYSLAEQVRRTDHPGSEPPAFGRGIPARGAPDPETAVREGLDATIRSDVRRLVELTPPGEMAVLHDYGPLLVEQVGEPDPDPDLEITELELASAEGPDGTTVVSAESFEAELVDEYGSTSWSYDGACTTITRTFTDGWFNSAPNEGVIHTEPDGSEAEPDVFRQCDDDTGLVQGSMFLWSYLDGGPGGQLKVVVEEVDGAWYLSPSRSLIESTLGQLRSISGADMRTAARIWSGELWLLEPDELWAACGVERPADDADREEGEAAAEACYEALPEDYRGRSFFGVGYGHGYGYGDDVYSSEETLVVDDLTSVCYELEYDEGDAAAEACFRSLVEAGEATPEDLASFRCELAYPLLDDDATDEEWDAAEEAYSACVDGVDGVEAGSTTATTFVPAPPTPTTALAPVPTTAAPATSAPAAASTTTAPAGSTTTAPG